MSATTTWLTAIVLWIPLVVTASTEDEGKLIQRKPIDREPTTEKEFLIRAISREVAEVKFAEIAAKRAENAEVRKLAEGIAEEHKKVRDGLLEQAKEIKVAVVEGLEKTHREEYDRLSKLKGEEFDREYLRWVIQEHDKGVKLYKKWAKEATTEGIRKQIDGALLKVQDHLAHAKKLQGRLEK